MLENISNLNVILWEKTSLCTYYMQQYRLSEQNCFCSQNKLRKINLHSLVLYKDVLSSSK
jgi:hypothetical protein